MATFEFPSTASVGNLLFQDVRQRGRRHIEPIRRRQPQRGERFGYVRVLLRCVEHLHVALRHGLQPARLRPPDHGLPEVAAITSVSTPLRTRSSKPRSEFPTSALRMRCSTGRSNTPTGPFTRWRRRPRILGDDAEQGTYRRRNHHTRDHLLHIPLPLALGAQRFQRRERSVHRL